MSKNVTKNSKKLTRITENFYAMRENFADIGIEGDCETGQVRITELTGDSSVTQLDLLSPFLPIAAVLFYKELSEKR